MNKRIVLITMAVGIISLPFFKALFSSQLDKAGSETVQARLVEIPTIPPEPKAGNQLHAFAPINKAIPSNSPQEEKREDIKNDIAQIEAAINETNAIERLNANTVEPKERAMLGEQLQHLDRLRAQELDRQLLDLEKEVALLEAALPARLQAYGVTQP